MEFLHFTRKSRKKCITSALVTQISTNFDKIMQNVSLKYEAVKNFNFKIQDGGQPSSWKSKNRDIMMQYRSLQRTGGLPSWIFETEVFEFNNRALQRCVLHHRARFCGDWSCCYINIAKCLRNPFFLVKCTNSLEDTVGYTTCYYNACKKLTWA